MAIIYTKLPSQIVADKIGAETLYFWTRSVITSADLVDSNDPKRVFPLYAPPIIDGTYVEFRWPAGWSKLLPGVAQIRTFFEGEPLREIGGSWLLTEADRKNPAEMKKAWLRCRQNQADNSGRKFFLDLEKHTNTNFLFSVLSPDESVLRKKALKQAGDYTMSRLKELACVARYPNLGRYPWAVAQISDLMACLLARHYGADLTDAFNDFEAFAAGRLRQPCKIGGGYDTLMACDVDSAYVFFFAQFVLAVFEYKQGCGGRRWAERARFWAQFLDVFVRMQTLYLCRWKNEGDPKCFKDYNRSVPELDASIVERVRIEHAAHAGNTQWLMDRHQSNLRHVVMDDPARGGHCLDPR